jgi:hypothetical protein
MLARHAGPFEQSGALYKIAVKYRELAKFAQPAHLGDFYRGIAVRYAFMAQEASERANKDGFTPERRVRPEPFGAQGRTEDVSIDARKRREKVGGGHACTREVRIGLGSTSAIMGALAFGFTLGLVVKYGLADAGPRRVPARLSDLETASSTSFDLQRRYGSQVPSTSGMRLASLEMSVNSRENRQRRRAACFRVAFCPKRVCAILNTFIGGFRSFAADPAGPRQRKRNGSELILDG